MTIEPDTKDWTWVLDRPCQECGFDASALAFRDVPAVLAESAAVWPAVLRRPTVRRRPEPGTWSPLEYAAHVRDVFVLFGERLQLMLTQDEPHFANWDQDATAIESDYANDDPERVAGQLSLAAETTVRAFADVPDQALQRKGFRSDGSVFTVQTLANYFVHDIVHHRHDVNG